MVLKTYMEFVLADGLGGTELDLVDGTNYQLVDVGWAPNVSTQKKSVLGGEPYTKVKETVRIMVYGTTAQICINNLNAIISYFEQAQRWADGENVNAIVMGVRMQGSDRSSTEYMSAVVLGGESNKSAVSNPPTYNDDIKLFWIGPVTLTFWRKGGLNLPAGLGVTAPVGGDDVNEIIQVTWPTEALEFSPVDIITDIQTYTGSIVLPSSFWLTAPEDGIAIATASLLNTGPFTSVAEAATLPRGGSILRYTPADTNWHWSNPVNMNNSNFQFLEAFLDMRSNISAVTWEVAMRVHTRVGSDDEAWADSKTFVISGADALLPLWYSLGLIGFRDGANYARIGVKASTTTGSPHLDFSMLAWLTRENIASSVIAFSEKSIARTLAADDYDLLMTSEILYELNPSIEYRDSSIPTQPITLDNWRGFPGIYTIGDELWICWLTSGPGNYWRYKDPAANLQNYNPLAIRYESFMVPG